MTMPEVLPLPPVTDDMETALADLRRAGVCMLRDVLSESAVATLRDKLVRQARAEQALGELAPKGMVGNKQFVPNRSTKGASSWPWLSARRPRHWQVHFSVGIFCCRVSMGMCFGTPLHSRRRSTGIKARCRRPFNYRLSATCCGRWMTSRQQRAAHGS